MTIDWEHEMRARREAQRPKQPTKRAGKTPEAKVKAEVERYLKQIGALSLRTGAGLVVVGDRKFSMGRAGGSDLTACLPSVGIFCAIECKTATGRLTDLQRRYGEKVTALGGLFVEARGKADVRAALVGRFGEATVKEWETRK